MPKQPPQGRGSGGRVTPSSRSAAGPSPADAADTSAGRGKPKARVPKSTKPATSSKSSKATKATRATRATKATKATEATEATGSGKATTPTTSAKSGATLKPGGRTTAKGTTGKGTAGKGTAGKGTAGKGTGAKGKSAAVVEEERPKGLKGFLTGPPDPNYVPPSERERPWWGMGDMALWFFVANILGGVAIAVGAMVGGYSLTWPSGPGSAVGEVVGRVSVGQAASVTKTAADIPFVQYSIVQLIPLWIAFLGGPLLVVKRKGTSLKEDFGFTMEWKDVPLGLAIGIVTQIVLISVLYRIIFVFTGEQDVSAEAERLVDRASSPLTYLLLFVVVTFGSPVFEELFFRGLSQRAIGKRLGPIWGLVLAAVFFALVHGQYLQFPGLLLFGLILGYLAMRFNRLGPSIWAHIGFNMVTAVILIWNQIVR